MYNSNGKYMAYTQLETFNYFDIDQKKAEEAWNKIKDALSEKGVDVKLDGDKHQIYCTTDAIEHHAIKGDDKHYNVDFYPLRIDIDADDAMMEFDLALAKKEDGSYYVVTDYSDTGEGIFPLKTQEIEAYLNEIANSNPEAQREIGKEAAKPSSRGRRM